MPNQWNERDILRLTRDCELGPEGAMLLVVKTSGPYMSVCHAWNLQLMHTGRDYAFAVKIGQNAPQDMPTDDGLLFGWAGNELAVCEARLREVERRMRDVPTARHCADRVGEVCAKLEEIAEEFASADHTGST